MTSKDDLLREGRELLKKGQELLDKAEALSRPDPVTACVGDSALYKGCECYTATPSTSVSFVTLRFGDCFEAKSLDVNELTTLDGRKICRVVPFRIKAYQPLSQKWYICNSAGLGYQNGDATISADLEKVKRRCEEAAKALWPWYDGPAYIVEK